MRERGSGISCVYDDFYARHYDTLFHNDKYAWEAARLRRVLRRGCQVLDVGCGTGIHAALLARDHQVTGLDVSEDMLAVARQRTPAARFVCGDANHVDLFPPASFDALISMYAAVLYNEDLATILRNFRIWLRSGGHACVSVLDRRALQDGPVQRSVQRPVGATTDYGEFEYLSHWEPGEGNRVAYRETFRFHDREVSRRHTFFIPPLADIMRLTREAGLRLSRSISLADIGYADERILVLAAP